MVSRQTLPRCLAVIDNGLQNISAQLSSPFTFSSWILIPHLHRSPSEATGLPNSQIYFLEDLGAAEFLVPHTSCRDSPALLFTMSSNVGLSTPRGSGTSGYVQRNLSLLKPRDAGVGQPYSLSDRDRAPKQRKPDQNILQHDRLREIEVKVLELRDRLEEEAEKAEEDGKDVTDDEEIEERCEDLRKKLTEEMERDTKKGRGGGSRLKSYQVHEMAEAKELESERLRRALGLKGDETGHDGEHPMARQDKRRREKEADDMKREEERVRREAERERR